MLLSRCGRDKNSAVPLFMFNREKDRDFTVKTAGFRGAGSMTAGLRLTWRLLQDVCTGTQCALINQILGAYFGFFTVVYSARV
jgi:hypothetical protein